MIIENSYTQLLEIIKQGIDGKDWEQIVVGLSGGKDSTVVAQLVIDVVIENNIDIPVTFISSDTKIENPLITSQLEVCHEQIQKIAKTNNKNFKTEIVYAPANERFFYKSIGLGYSTPLNSTGRWCTRLLKVKPMQRIYNAIDEDNLLTLLLTGVRESESTSRKRNITNYFGNDLLVRTNDHLYSYAPIRDWTVEYVWTYLMDFNRDDNYKLDNCALSQLYLDGTDEKMCPSSADLALTENAEQCGTSRYGCYICPLVKNDNTLVANINNGHKFEPYMELRKWYMDRAYNMAYRDRMNRKGVTKFKIVGINPKTNMIRFTRLKEVVNLPLDKFQIIKCRDEKHALDIVNENTRFNTNQLNKDSIFYNNNEILFLYDSEYHVALTGRLSLQFRLDFYNMILEIENTNDIVLIDKDERELILSELNL